MQSRVSIAPEELHMSSTTSFDSTVVTKQSIMTTEERKSLISRIRTSILAQDKKSQSSPVVPEIIIHSPKEPEQKAEEDNTAD